MEKAAAVMGVTARDVAPILTPWSGHGIPLGPFEHLRMQGATRGDTGWRCPQGQVGHKPLFVSPGTSLRSLHRAIHKPWVSSPNSSSLHGSWPWETAREWGMGTCLVPGAPFFLLALKQELGRGAGGIFQHPRGWWPGCCTWLPARCRRPSGTSLLAANLLQIVRILPGLRAQERRLGAAKKAEVISSREHFLGSFTSLQRLADKAGR